jgi:alpha-L-fucosidase
VNDRLSNTPSGSIKDAQPPAYAGDFDTCELNTPHEPTCNARGQILPWELWITHSNAWCHSSKDQDFKSAASILRTLVNCVSKSGNLTLNFGPDARGNLPPHSIDVLNQIGDWMALNSASIHGCGLAALERPDWGRWTLNPRTGRLYAHIMEQPMGHLTLRGLRGRVRRPRVLATGADAFLTDYWNPGVQTFGRPDDIFLNLHQPVSYTYPMPDPIDTVVEFDTVPEPDQSAATGG